MNPLRSTVRRPIADAVQFALAVWRKRGAGGGGGITVYGDFPAMTQGVAITSFSFTASGGTGPYTYSVFAGALPAGLSMTGAGLVSGTPSASGAYSVTIRATDTLAATGNGARSGSVAAGGSFSPADLFIGGYAGCWYDPSDLGTMWQDSARTTPVTANGQPVGAINDKSGNGNHLTQATAGKRPLYRTSGGLHWLEFDGVDDALSAAALGLSGLNEITIFSSIAKVDDTARIVSEYSTSVSGNLGSFYHLAGTDAGFVGHVSLSRAGAAVNSGQAAGINSSGADTSALTIKHNLSGDLSTIKRNGTSGTNGTADKGVGTFGSYAFYVGARAGTSLYFNGKIYSYCVLGKTSSAGEDASMEAHISAKAGL